MIAIAGKSPQAKDVGPQSAHQENRKEYLRGG